MNGAGRVALAIVGLVVGIVAVLALREATLTTHEPVPQDSRIELVVTAHSKGGGANQTLAERVEAQLLTCRLEVASDLVGEVEREGANRFRAVFAPSMDESNRRQFRGCIEDWIIDHVRLDVVHMKDVT
jgi:Na+/H+-translocating membrane pyrophosphatase